MVDDDRLLRETLLELVDDCGCNGLQAADGHTALQLFTQHRIDLVVSDVDMPEMSGFELLARLQQAAFSGPIILASARADEDMEQAAQRAGASGLFTKPVPVGDFCRKLTTLLNL